MSHSSKVLEPFLRVRLLGVLQVVCGDAAPRALALPSGPVARLFAYLALHTPASIPRSRLAWVLHPELPEPAARRALADTLYRLRGELGDAAGCIDTSVESVGLDTSRIWVDAHEFRRRAAGTSIEDWQDALELYTGDLLEDQDDEWILAPRAALREQWLATHEQLHTGLVQTSRWSEALACAHRWTLADPLSEQAHRAAMQLYDRLGRPAAALEQYERLARLLADELGAGPLPETRALAEAIRQEYDATREPVQERRPFVGRRRELAYLLRAAEQAQAAHGDLVLVEGEAGVGKTCLLEQFAEGARWRGLDVIWGRARELAATPPYAPLGQALAAALAGPRAAQVRERLEPAAAQALAFLVPRLQVEAAKPASPPDLSAAVALTIRALAALGPYVFIFDDVQWAEAGFWEAMRHLGPLLAEERILILLCYRSEELRTNTVAWSQLRALDSDLAPLRITLGGLALGECVEMARELGHSLDEHSSLALFERTGGNPLYFAEALAEPMQTSASFRTLLERRWANLPVTAQQALQAGAVVGREFTYGTWQALADTSLLEEVPLLIAARFVDETDHGYYFQHDLTREYVYKTASVERLRELHRRAGLALAREGVGPGVLAWHYEQAQEWNLAVRHYRLAAERAENAYAYRTALEHCARALALVPRSSQSQGENILLLRCRQRALGALLLGTEWRLAVQALEQAARQADDTAGLLEALEAQVTLRVLDSDWPGMQAVAHQAISLAESMHELGAEARLQSVLGWHLSDSLGQQAAARPHLERAIELADAVGNWPLLGEALSNLAFSQRMQGKCALAQETAQRGLKLTTNRPELRSVRAGALQTMAQIQVDLARWELARTMIQGVVELRRELGEAWGLGQALFTQVIIAAWSGRPDEARQALESLASGLSSPDHLAALHNWMWVRALAAHAHILAGDCAAAERVLGEMQSWMASTEDGRAVLLALMAQGQLRLAQGRPREALGPLTRAVHLWRAAPTIEVTTLLYHALAAHRSAETAAAQASLTAAEQMLSGTDVARYNVLLSSVRYELTGRSEHLEVARAEIQRQAALFTEPQLRSDFMSQVQLHRDIEDHWQTLQVSPPPLLVRLARMNAPLGKKLADSEYVQVRWTVDAGPSDAALGEQQGKVALRQHRLRRLLAQASAQGAAPTDEDLAQALGVERRTILRDMAGLRSAGHAAATRKRRH